MNINGNLSRNQSAANEDWLYELKMSRKIMQQYLGQLVTLLGICANLINMVVLAQRRMRVTSTNCYLLVLAAYDMLFLILSGFLNLSVVEFPNVKHESWYDEVCKFVKPTANLLSNGAAWLVCAFTLERYIAVCYPMKGRIWCTTRRARWIIIGVCCVSAAITFPEFIPQIDAVLFVIGYYWINSCLFTFIPIVALSVFNSLLIYTVVQATRARKEMQEPLSHAYAHTHTHAHAQNNRNDCRRSILRLAEDESRSHMMNSKQERATSEQQRLTTMLIVVVLVFLICQIPAAINLLFRAYLNTHRILLSRGHENLRRIFGGFSNFLVQLNHASNFIVYSFFSTKFRHTFRRVFCTCSTNCRPHSTAALVINTTCANDSTDFCRLGRRSSFGPLTSNYAQLVSTDSKLGLTSSNNTNTNNNNNNNNNISTITNPNTVASMNNTIANSNYSNSNTNTGATNTTVNSCSSGATLSMPSCMASVNNLSSRNITYTAEI